jgi:proteasome lid subunit RPN8/RPN11
MAENAKGRVTIYPVLEKPSPAPASYSRISTLSGQESGIGGLTLYRCEGETEKARGCNVIFPQSLYRKVVEHLSEDTSREHGGFLLGFEIPADQPGGPAVYVTEAIAARHTEGSPVRLTFTTETWRDLDKQIADKYSDPAEMPQRIGWYHSHPNISIFLSHWDLDVCQTYDRRKYPVALVVDPVNNRGGFFVGGTKGYQAHSPRGFYEQRDLQGEPMVTWINMTRVSRQTTKPEPALSLPKEAPAFPREEKDELPAFSPNKHEQRRVVRLSGMAQVLVPSVLAIAIVALFINHLREARMIQALEAELHTFEAAGSPGSAAAHADTDAATVPPARTPDVAPPAIPAGTVTVIPPVTAISLNPAKASLRASQSARFQSTVAGTKSAQRLGVDWSIKPPGVGRISSKGLYTAPAAIASPATVEVVATSRADPGKSGSATVTLEPPVSRTPAVVTSGAPAPVAAPPASAATPSGGNPTSATASTGSGPNASATAATPTPAPAAPSADPSHAKAETNELASSLSDGTLKVTASKMTLSEGESANLFATLGGVAADVTWKTEGVGSISSGGIYTAPSVIKAGGDTVTITATSNSTRKSSSVKISLAPHVNF